MLNEIINIECIEILFYTSDTQDNYKSIKMQKQYLNSIFIRDIDYFLDINTNAINLNKLYSHV